MVEKLDSQLNLDQSSISSQIVEPLNKLEVQQWYPLDPDKRKFMHQQQKLHLNKHQNTIIVPWRLFYNHWFTSKPPADLASNFIIIISDWEWEEDLGYKIHRSQTLKTNSKISSKIIISDTFHCRLRY